MSFCSTQHWDLGVLQKKVKVFDGFCGRVFFFFPLVPVCLLVIQRFPFSVLQLDVPAAMSR
jgi:hypothetical protein